MSKVRPETLESPNREASEMANDLSLKSTPHLDQLLIEISAYKEIQRASTDPIPQTTVDALPVKPEFRRVVSILSAHSKSSNPVRRAPSRNAPSAILKQTNQG